MSSVDLLLLLCDDDDDINDDFDDVVDWQLELDKTADDFRRAHVERQELLARWQQTIDTMQKRDEAMDLLAAVRLSLSLRVHYSNHVYTIQPVVQPVVNRFDNRLYRVNGGITVATKTDQSCCFYVSAATHVVVLTS